MELSKWEEKKNLRKELSIFFMLNLVSICSIHTLVVNIMEAKTYYYY